LGNRFLILPEFISSAPSSCRATLLDFLPFFLCVCLGESCGCTSPSLTPRSPISPCAHFRPLALASSLRRNKYWRQSSCSVSTLSTPCLFQYVYEVYPFPFHQVFELRIFCAYFDLCDFHLSLCVLHGGVFISDLSFHWSCAASLFLLVVRSVSGLIWCLFSDFLIVFRILISLYPLIGFIPSF
jgi:hypothetical protein